jgi:hypothetical protein
MVWLRGEQLRGFHANPLEVDQMVAIGAVTDAPLDMRKCRPYPR